MNLANLMLMRSWGVGFNEEDAIIVKKEGITLKPRNFTYSSIGYDYEVSIRKCHLCPQNGILSYSHFYCFNCLEYYCESCSNKIHQSLFSYQSHIIISTEQLVEQKITTLVKLNHLNRIEKEKLEESNTKDLYKQTHNLLGFKGISYSKKELIGKTKPTKSNKQKKKIKELEAEKEELYDLVHSLWMKLAEKLTPSIDYHNLKRKEEAIKRNYEMEIKRQNQKYRELSIACENLKASYTSLKIEFAKKEYELKDKFTREFDEKLRTNIREIEENFQEKGTNILKIIEGKEGEPKKGVKEILYESTGRFQVYYVPQWFYWNDETDTWTPYICFQQKIERQYQDWIKNYTILKEEEEQKAYKIDLEIENKKYEIHFIDLIQKNNTTGTRRKVKRELVRILFPLTSLPPLTSLSSSCSNSTLISKKEMDDNQKQMDHIINYVRNFTYNLKNPLKFQHSFEKKILDPQTSMYEYLSHLFYLKGIDKRYPMDKEKEKIINIWEIEHPYLNYKFECFKQWLSSPALQTETYLFHGTSTNNYLKVIEKGLDVRVGRENGYLGQAIYLTNSMRYVHDGFIHKQNNKEEEEQEEQQEENSLIYTVLVMKTLLGSCIDFTNTPIMGTYERSCLRQAPINPLTDYPADSTTMLAEEKTPIFGIYNNDQVVPAFIIQYKIS